MLIAVNTRFLLKDKLEGIGWYTYETMRRLTERHPEHTFLFLFDREYDPSFIFSKNIIPVKVWPPARHPYLWQFWFDYSLPKVFKKYQPDLFISTDGFLSLKTHVPTLLVMHDLGFEHYPEHTPAIVSKYYRKFSPLFAHKAKHIITVSEFSKQDIIRHYQIPADKIDVAHNGANAAYIPLNAMEKEAVRAQYTEGNNYFIYVGSVHPRKNVKNLLLAYDMLRKENATNNKLVVAGRMAWKTDETQEVFNNLTFKEDVIFSGHLQLHELTRIVAAADAFVYPSLFEGFGIPVVEARYCGVPVITSNRSSLMEVGGDNAIYFDPENVTDICDAIKKFIADQKMYEQAAQDISSVKQQFNWDRSTDIMEHAILKCNIPNRTRKPHFA